MATSPTYSSPELEKIILGLLVTGEGQREIFSLLSLEDLATPLHGVLFRSCKSLFDRGIHIDVVSLFNECHRRGDTGVTPDLISSLGAHAPIPAKPTSYIHLLREYTATRKIDQIRRDLDDRIGAVGVSPRDLIDGAVDKLRIIREGLETTSPLESTEQIIDSIGELELLSPAKSALQFKTGFRRLDEMTCGFIGMGFTIIGGRPSSGKTSFALSTAMSMAKRAIPVGIFSLEMHKRSLLERMITMEARVNLLEFRSGATLTREERERLRISTATVKDLPIYINDRSMNCQELMAHVDRIKRDKGVKVVFVDYAQLLHPEKGYARRTQNEVMEKISKDLKLIAKECGVAMVVLSQLSRASEQRGGDHRPMLSDLRASGGFEQDADLVIFIYREWIYKRSREDLRDHAEVIVSKQRNGPAGTVHTNFRSDYALFED
jgi:replicative DNA helicase